MPRDIPVGNGNLLVNFDQSYQLRDLYWPRVGQENHTAGHAFRFGVWVDGVFSWVADGGWERDLDYETPGQPSGSATLVTHVRLYHPGLEIELICRDLVDFHDDLYLRQIDVRNLAEARRQVRLFFHHDLHISGHGVGDSAYYEPERRSVFHYKGRHWFLIQTAKEAEPDSQDSEEGYQVGVDQWAVGVKETPTMEGTWRDAEDGVLSGNAVAQGSVDSTVALHLDLPAKGSRRGWHWIAVGEDFRAVTAINRAVRARGAASYLERTRDYWALWSTKEQLGRAAGTPDPLMGIVGRDLARLYRRSLLILRTQIDNGGAIIAANDYDVTHYNHDTYSYMWPRDGALVTAALVQAGYSELTRRFFNFCHQVITDEGYLLHKYNPDGSLASSWHGWYHDGVKQLPIQEDETALVLWALWLHFEQFKDIEFIKPHYRGLIVRAANWLVAYRDPNTGLPQPSWDLWEERRGVSSWTVGATWAGLQAASRFTEAFGQGELAERYRTAAAEIKEAATERFWAESEGRYARMLTLTPGGDLQLDTTVDSALVGLWYFGMFTSQDAIAWDRTKATMEALRANLWIKTDVGGMARYVGDPYYRTGDPDQVPGNPWFICTLWLAQWLMTTAQSLDDLQEAIGILTWVAERALPSGVLAEQVHPYTNAPLSVSPLTWSHATFVMAINDYLERRQVLLRGSAGGA